MARQIQELREKQATLVAESRERIDSITDTMTPAEVQEREAAHDAAMAEYDKIGKQIERLEQLDQREKSLLAADPRRPNNDSEGRSDVDGDPNRLSEATVFRRAVQFGLNELAPEERAVMAKLQANLPPEARALSIGTTTAGGFTIPQGFLAEVTKSMAAWGPLFDENITRVIRTASGNPLPWPTVNDTANTGVDHTENTADADQDVVFGQKQLDAYVHGSGIVKVSFELLQDSAFDIEDLLRELFGERLGRRGNAKLTTGTGTNQPNGVVTASSAGKTAVSTTAIAADEIIDHFHSVDPAYRGSPKARWMMHDNVVAAVRKLKDGQGNYLWQMGDVKASEPDRLLGKPISVNQAMSSAFTTGQKLMLFGDFGKYIVRQVRDFQMLVLRERYAEALQVGFMAYNRFDGELADTAAIKHYKLA